jgi:hypothetical protein
VLNLNVVNLADTERVKAGEAIGDAMKFADKQGLEKMFNM